LKYKCIVKRNRNIEIEGNIGRGHWALCNKNAPVFIQNFLLQDPGWQATVP